MDLDPDALVSASDPDHCFMVFRLLPDGRWVGSWSEETKATVEFRGQCTCGGWEGPQITGNLRSGQEADDDRERVYAYWDRNHAPDWEARHKSPSVPAAPAGISSRTAAVAEGAITNMDHDVEHELRLSTSDIMTLRIGLTAYLREFAAHRAEDGAATHPASEWQALQKQIGQLLWRLEEATTPPGAYISHGEHAARPDDT